MITLREYRNATPLRHKRKGVCGHSQLLAVWRLIVPRALFRVCDMVVIVHAGFF